MCRPLASFARMTELSFAERYGPWALVAGASEGVGAAFAEAVADRGVSVVLLARRGSVLDEVAAAIRDRAGVDTRTVVADLAEEAAAAAVVEATAGLDIGLLVYCAGADPNYEPFLANPVGIAEAMVVRNCLVPLQLCHHLAQLMVARGRGGIVLLGSGAAFAGAPNMVAYGASKAFDLVFGEALWTELHPQGVDVVSLVLGLTDTPALRRLREKRGQVDDPDRPLPGASTVDEVVGEAFAGLADGPTRMVGELVREGARFLGSRDRNEAVRFTVEASAGAMGPRDPA